jgi:shikimate kinase
MKLALIGLRGSGKSTVGRILAARLNWEFHDTDEIVQREAGLTIRELFESRGEAGFRALEKAAVGAVCSRCNAVIATGGGAVLDPENAAALKRGGFVVHLTAEPRELWRRISQDASSRETRPKLIATAESGIDELKKLMRARAGVYSQVRDVEVDVEARSPDEVADAVIVLMRAHGVLK